MNRVPLHQAVLPFFISPIRYHDQPRLTTLCSLHIGGTEIYNNIHDWGSYTVGDTHVYAPPSSGATKLSAGWTNFILSGYNFYFIISLTDFELKISIKRFHLDWLCEQLLNFCQRMLRVRAYAKFRKSCWWKSYFKWSVLFPLRCLSHHSCRIYWLSSSCTVCIVYNFQ